MLVQLSKFISYNLIIQLAFFCCWCPHGDPADMLSLSPELCPWTYLHIYVQVILASTCLFKSFNSTQCSEVCVMSTVGATAPGAPHNQHGVARPGSTVPVVRVWQQLRFVRFETCLPNRCEPCRRRTPARHLQTKPRGSHLHPTPRRT